MQHHIYQLGLLGGRCSDIRIRAFGRLYHLHRLVLIQSGFFRAMLCGGYAEDLAAESAAANLSKKHSHRESHASPPSSSSSANAASATHKDTDNDAVELHFDDPNISRAAFEYCIARLYGDGPKLVLPFWSTPSSTHPFSPALAMRVSQPSDLQLANLLIHKRSHPATPRFLLSLLATSIYLNIPSVTSQALTLVICSVTPFTVVQYLRFAIGCGIEGTDLHRSASDEMLHDLDEWDWELEAPARTLEDLARSDPSTSAAAQKQTHTNFDSLDATVSDDFAHDFSNKVQVTSSTFESKHESTTPTREAFRSRQSQSLYPESLSGEPRSQTPGRDEKRSAKKTAGFRDTGPTGLDIHTTENIAPEYQYGLTADKIGEACVCWFARWGFDIFELESSMERERVIEIETWISMCREDRDYARLAVLRDRLHTGDVDLLHTSMLPRGRMPDPKERMPSPRLRVWSYPSMPSSWVRAIISSDAFFVPSEQHRYEFAKKVVEFRRRQKALINVLDRLIDDWIRKDEDKIPASEASKKAGGATKASTHSAALSDAGDGFGFKAFRRTSSVGGNDDADAAAATPLQEAWNDGVDPTSFSPSIDQDEAEYEELFSSGIYYSHMPFAALNKIGADVSPTTGRPYTPLHVLQAALWISNELKMHIMSSTDDSRRKAILAAMQEAEAAGRDASSVDAPDSIAQDMDGAGELGISSSITEFREAFESSLHAANSQRRFSRSRSTTPGYMTDDGDANMSFGSTSGLGGLAASPLMLGALGGGKAGLLSKRFYMVPSDDTVRFGDGLMSVVGSTAGTASIAGRAPSSEDGRGNATSVFADDNLGPSGTAAIQLPHTLPINAVIHHDTSNQSNQQRDLSHYYGMANDVATGRELGEFAYRHLSPTSEASARESSPRHFDESDARRSTAGESASHSHDPNDDGDGADAESIDSNGMSPERWSGYEPMRIGVEFFGIDKLQEKQRLYSPTFFYAGSVWNLYIQVVKKVKGIQLGIYLHRQSLLESLPPPSAPTPVEGGEQVAPGLSADGVWPGGSVETPTSRTSHRDRQGSTTPSGAEAGAAAHTSSSRTNRTAQQQFAASNSMFASAAAAAPTITDDGVGGEGNGTLFDTSFTSPVRAGGHGYSASMNTTGSGSTLTMPNGRTITRMGGSNSSSSPMRNNNNNNNTTHDLFALDNNDPTQSSATASSAANSLTASHADPTSLSSPFFSIDSTPIHNTTRTSTMPTNTTSNPITSSNTTVPPFHPPPIVPLYPSGPSVYSICPLPAAPYRDTRKELRAYFSIHCHSPLGTALTKFSSGPDKFTISQSWGWKSSSLLGTVHLENGDLESGKQGLWYRFRCVCTIGLV